MLVAPLITAARSAAHIVQTHARLVPVRLGLEADGVVVATLFALDGPITPCMRQGRVGSHISVHLRQRTNHRVRSKGKTFKQTRTEREKKHVCLTILPVLCNVLNVVDHSLDGHAVLVRGLDIATVSALHRQRKTDGENPKWGDRETEGEKGTSMRKED